MSHELRTPLNAVIGFSEVMTCGVFGPLGSPHYLEYFQDIHRSGVFLHDLISDMLDMVKIEAGHRTLQVEPFVPYVEIEETLRMIRPRAKKGGVIVGLDVRDAPATLKTASVKGTGLGVALTKSLAELHGWRLGYASELGRGTTATIVLPGAAKAAEAASAVEPSVAA